MCIRVWFDLYNLMCLQDAFWRYVAKAMKETPVEDADGWLEPVTNLAYDFLIDEDVSFSTACIACV